MSTTYPFQRPTMDDFLREAERKFSNIFNLSVAQITEAIASACEFFGIPYPDMVYNLTYQENGQTMFVNRDASTYADDIICYNLAQLQALGATNQTALSLIMTHECAHRYFQDITFPGMNDGAWEEELACDYFMGVRSGMQNLNIERVAEGLRQTQGGKTHPNGDLRYMAIRQGQQDVLFMTRNDYALSINNFLHKFEEFRVAIEPTIFAREIRYQD